MLKRIMMLSLSFLLLSGCTTNETDAPLDESIYYYGKIVAIENEIAYLSGKENADLLTLPLKDIELAYQDEEIEISDLQTGMEVHIAFDGSIMESYPAKLSNPTKLIVKEEEADLVGMYREMIHEIYNYDSALNGEKYIAFDLSKEQNLSEGEKSALVYLLGNDLQLEPLVGTYEELVKDGYIDDEQIYFKDGVLIKLASEPSDTDFKFSVEKWRGGLGANFYNDCQATLDGNQYHYELGGFAIS